MHCHCCCKSCLAERFWQRVSQFGEGVLVAALKCRVTGSFLVAAVTHLWFDPRHPEIKVAQANALCQAVVQFIEEQPWEESKGSRVGREEGEIEAERSGLAASQLNAACAATIGDGDSINMVAAAPGVDVTADQVAAAGGSEASDAAGSASPSAAADGLQGLKVVPVVIAGDFNSLWRKYKEDIWDPVRREGAEGVKGLKGGWGEGGYQYILSNYFSRLSR
jgi:hypothetical protein